MKSLMTLLVTLMFTGFAVAQEIDPCANESGAAYGLCSAYCEAMDCDSDDPNADDQACEIVSNNYQKITGKDFLPCGCPCFVDDEWSRIWAEWPATGVSVQCAESPSTYSFELGHWVFGDDKAREYIAVVDIDEYSACRVQYGDNPSSTYDISITITSAQVQFCAELMRAKAEDEGVTCD